MNLRDFNTFHKRWKRFHKETNRAESEFRCNASF